MCLGLHLRQSTFTTPDFYVISIFRACGVGEEEDGINNGKLGPSVSE